ncbi:MAG: aspartate:alanine exchanger family transporter [Desulfuromonadaceae bacterium]
MLTNPLLLVCLAISCGAMLGSISIKKVSLGVAGVLFAGIIWGYIEPGVKPPDALATFGLALFVYAIGLSSSDFLFETFSGGGWRYLFIPPVAIGSAIVVDLIVAPLLNIPASTAAGVFAGALTNTPSLAAATTALGEKGAEATLGYAFAYPLGVLIPIIMLSVPFRNEKHDTGDKLSDSAIMLTNVREPGEAVAGLLERYSLQVRFARCIRGAEQFAISGNSVVKNGDIVTAVGLLSDLRDAVEKLGAEYTGDILKDRSRLDVRRIFASSPHVCGKTLRKIGIFRMYEGIVTRVRRGDRDFIPNAETTIMPGDRLRVVAPPENLSAISEFIGDSYHEASEFNVLTFGLGLAMGIALGTIAISLPMGIGTFEIGPVAGCLIVALALGALGRTGPLTWYLPYGASMSLRQLGLVVFLACAGIKAGGLLHSAPLNISALILGAGITIVTCLVTIAMARMIAGKSWPFIGGILAGVQTQPAVLGFAVGRCGNERVESGYAETYPLSMLVKIIFVQLFLLFSK